MAQQITKCTGCGTYSTEYLGVNKNGEPYLACCPDSDYKPMAQQTAVEWLVEQYANENYGIEVYEQAKQKEREQIKNAYIVGSVDELPYDKDAEQYYTKTYGK